MVKKLLFFIFIFAAQSLFAYDCTTYATRAKKYALAAAALNWCYFSGPRWIVDYQPHFNWCNSVALTTARAEDVARTNQLKQCATNYTWITQCNSYAYRATRQYAASYQLGCGYSGNRWHINYNAHFNWCNTANLQTINYEDTQRRNGLGRCMRAPGYYLESNSGEYEDLEDFDNGE